MSTFNWSKEYFKWGLFIRPLQGVEVLVAAFVFEANARDYGKIYPKQSKAIIRWIGEGNPPGDIDGGFTALVW